MENFPHYMYNLFALGKADEDEYAPVLLLADSERNLPLPCPGIMRQKDINVAMSDDRPKRRFAYMSIPFCPREGQQMRQRISVSPAILPMEPKNLIKEHRLEIVDKFPLESLPQIKEAARERGAVSFIVEKHSEMRKAVEKLDQEAAKVFKYVTCMKYNVGAGTRKLEEDRLSLALSFIELPYCIPIYNANRVDGVGVIVSLIYQPSSIAMGGLNFRDMYGLVFSNYEDNVFKIDGGSRVNKFSPIPGGLKEHFYSSIKEDLANISGKSKSKKAEPAPKEAKKKVKVRASAKKVTYGTTLDQYIWSNTSSSSSTTTST